MNLVEHIRTALEPIDATAANAYEQHMPTIIRMVLQDIRQREDLSDFIGTNHHYLSNDILEYHARTLLSQFHLKSAETLVHDMAWLYRLVISRGFSPSYIPLEMHTWRNVIGRVLDTDTQGTAAIQALYQCLIDSHPDLLVLSRVPQDTARVDESLVSLFSQYLDALLEPDTQQAIAVTKQFIKDVHDIPVWWEQVIWPAMHEIGRLWAEGTITVGQEHIATSITQRVMSVYYPMILDIPRQKGTVIVMVSPDELHEIGARMLADTLEIHGWDVHYTGANTPDESVVALIEDLRAQFLCISTTIPANLRHVTQTIKHVRQVRSTSSTNPVQIVVGGQAYKRDPNAWKQVGADGFAVSASQIIQHMQMDRHTMPHSLS